MFKASIILSHALASIQSKLSYRKVGGLHFVRINGYQLSVCKLRNGNGNAVEPKSASILDSSTSHPHYHMPIIRYRLDSQPRSRFTRSLPSLNPSRMMQSIRGSESEAILMGIFRGFAVIPMAILVIELVQYLMPWNG